MTTIYNLFCQKPVDITDLKYCNILVYSALNGSKNISMKDKNMVNIINKKYQDFYGFYYTWKDFGIFVIPIKNQSGDDIAEYYKLIFEKNNLLLEFNKNIYSGIILSYDEIDKLYNFLDSKNDN